MQRAVHIGAGLFEATGLQTTEDETILSPNGDTRLSVLLDGPPAVGLPVYSCIGHHGFGFGRTESTGPSAEVKATCPDDHATFIIKSAVGSLQFF